MARHVLLGDQSPEKCNWEIKASQVPASYRNTFFFMSQYPKPHPGSPLPQDKVCTPLPGDRVIGNWWELHLPSDGLQRTLYYPPSLFLNVDSEENETQEMNWLTPKADPPLSWVFSSVLYCVLLLSFLSKKDHSSMRVGKMSRFRNTAHQGSRRRKCRVVIRHVRLCSQTGFES